MRQLEIEAQLRDVVSRIVVQVELATAQGRTDINLALEDALIPILKPVFNLPHLINLNRKQKNYPGIDLGDDHDRVCFQVTSTTSLDKVKSTISQFMERSYYNDFDELYILMLGRKQGSYSQTSVNALLTPDFSFSCSKHIIDLSDLLRMVQALRLTAQERVLAEFKHILGEVDAFISLRSESVASPTAITTNLQEVHLPEAVYVAELTVDKKATIDRAKVELNYRGYARSQRSIVKMAMLLKGVETDAWACYENKLFSFHDIEQLGLAGVIDEGSIERLDIADLADSSELDNTNVVKQLLAAETRELLKGRHVRMHSKDGFFYFVPKQEGELSRKETWTGKRSASRHVYECRHQKNDPTKIAHHKHFSFDLTFSRLDEVWYVQIVPSWYYTFDGYRKSNYHDQLLTQQKRHELNLSVRNAVRFVSYFLTNTGAQADTSEAALRFGGLLEFDVREDATDATDATDAADEAEDGDEGDIEGEAA